MTIKERMYEFCQKNGIPKSEMTQKIDAAPSTFRGVAMTMGLNSDTIVTFLTIYPQVSAEWLMRGVGPMLLNDGTMATDHSIAVHTNEGSITQNNIPTGADLPTPAPVAPDCELCSKLTYAKMEVEHLKTLIEAKNETIQVLKDCLK